MTRERREKIINEAFAFAKLGGHKIHLSEKQKEINKMFIDGKISIEEWRDMGTRTLIEI